MAGKRPTGKGAGQSAPPSQLPPRRLDPKEFANIAQSQRNWLYGIASKITLRKELNQIERMMTAEILRTHADGIPDKEPGKPSKYNAADVAEHYACLIRQNRVDSPTAAAKFLAEYYGGTIQGMQKIVAKYGEAALAQYDQWSK